MFQSSYRLRGVAEPFYCCIAVLGYFTGFLTSRTEYPLNMTQMVSNTFRSRFRCREIWCDVRSCCRYRSWRAQLAHEASIARMKELDSAVIDDSLSLADVVRNATNEHGRSVQSKSYDVMYSATKSHRNEGRKWYDSFYWIIWHFLFKRDAYLSGAQPRLKMGVPFSFCPSLLPSLPSFRPPSCLPYLSPPSLSLRSSLPPCRFPSPPFISFHPFIPLLPSFFFFGGPTPWNHRRCGGELWLWAKLGRQTVSMHSEVKIDLWWVVTTVIKRFTDDELQLQVTW